MRMKTILFLVLSTISIFYSPWVGISHATVEGMTGNVPTEGQPVNVAPFGEITHWDAEGKDYGVIWEDSRDIFSVNVVFKPGVPLPPPDSLRLEYWQSSWPQHRIPRDQTSGSGSSGWLDVGDWFQGKWKKADIRFDRHENIYKFNFNPVNAKEFSDLGDFNASYRSTMKLRIASDVPLPPIVSFEAYTDSIRQPILLDIEWGGNAEKEQVWDGRFEIFNGKLTSVEPLAGGHVAVRADQSWQSKTQGKTDGIRAQLLYAKTKGYNSFDETIVTVRAAQETFSFAVRDLLQWEQIFIPDYGVLVRLAGKKVTYASAEQEWRHSREKDLYTRVGEVPEQTFPQAWNDTPPKDPHYIPLSFEGGRQHFGLDEKGDVFCIKNWITHLPGKDTDRCLWEGEKIDYRFGLPKSRPVARDLADGYLPIMETTWEEKGLRYRQKAFVIPLNGVPPEGGRIWADDTLVLMIRLTVEDLQADPAKEKNEAQLNIQVSDQNGNEELSLQGDVVYALKKGSKIARMMMAAKDSVHPTTEGQSLTCRSSLPLILDLKIPYITLQSEGELARLRSLAFDGSLKATRNYWRSRVDAGAQITTPEAKINDFYKAHAAHLLINTEREVGISDRYMAKVGTFNYGVYSNESCMMVSDLDRRGYHQRAEQALESWIHYQGTAGLPGDFSTTEGQLYGAGGYEHGGYNQHHGWILWCLGEHYWYTRDAAWMEHAAPCIIKACDFIIQERRRTMENAKQSPIRAIESGLLPMGRLEDIGDWRAWLSTNVYTWWGMQNAAAALTAAGHADGARLQKEAEQYKQDILKAYLEAMRRSPVARLRDGRWIPHIPSDVHRRGRSFGWITETLEGAIHLVRCGVLEPWDRLSTWILQDYEDNLYLSKQYGYDLAGKEFERFWFSRGGISQQANLLSNPIPYLLRGETKHFLRAYFNAFAVSYFPDTRMMTEHALPNIGDWRGDHYKSSDEANSTYWLRLMFIEERGGELRLGAAIPRYWLAGEQKIGIENAATYFGPMSMRMESHLKQGHGVIVMNIEPPRRTPPQGIRAYFRHPEGRRMTGCRVNGKTYNRWNAEKEYVEIDKNFDGLKSGSLLIEVLYE